MSVCVKISDVTLIVLSLLVLRECTLVFQALDSRYQLVHEAYSIARSVFGQGRANFAALKQRSLETIDAFLDLAAAMHREMAAELRAAVIKFYKITYFHDFTNYVISMDEMVDILEHCLASPSEKLAEIRAQFHEVVVNFRDVREWDVVERCRQQLPDEVAAAHCVLHQAVLFNETMQDSLIKIVQIKTRQHALDVNYTLFSVQPCISDFVPRFFEQLLLDAYTSRSGRLRALNASASDLLRDKWRANGTAFPDKWRPLV